MMRAQNVPRASPSPDIPASVSTSTMVFGTCVIVRFEYAAMRVTGTATAVARTDVIFMTWMPRLSLGP